MYNYTANINKVYLSASFMVNFLWLTNVKSLLWVNWKESGSPLNG